MMNEMNLMNGELDETMLEDVNGGCGFFCGYLDRTFNKKKKETKNRFYNWGWNVANRDQNGYMNVLHG